MTPSTRAEVNQFDLSKLTNKVSNIPELTGHCLMALTGCSSHNLKSERRILYGEMYFIYDNPLYQKESNLTGWLLISNRNFLEIPPSYVSDSFQARFQINFDVELPIKLTLISR